MNYRDTSVASTFNPESFSGGSSVGTTSFTTSSFNSVEFIGLRSMAAFDRVAVREDDGAANSDEFLQCFTATAVPAPGTLVLLGLGLVTLVRRRSARG